ncbi:MAG: hypothetical protein R3B99_06590 [Polyangiales bacterium]
MKVRKLIEILQELDPEASVYVMSQQSWPFEVAIHGVAVREAFTEADDAEAPDAPEASARPLERAARVPADERRVHRRGQPAPLRQQRGLGRRLPGLSWRGSADGRNSICSGRSPCSRQILVESSRLRPSPVRPHRNAPVSPPK